MRACVSVCVGAKDLVKMSTISIENQHTRELIRGSNDVTQIQEQRHTMHTPPLPPTDAA